MAFVVPEFPLLCDIYGGIWSSKTLRLSDVECNLTWGRREQSTFLYGTAPTSGVAQAPMTLLLPALTDIRDSAGLVGTVADLVECPAGTGRWYAVAYVDDIGKGFPNEHRAAIIYKVYEQIQPGQFPGLTWPFPIP